MPVTDCPNCDNDLVRSTGKTILDGEPHHRFECRECGHGWNKRML